ncbi:MAG TPA: serine/threonine-protein kinase [Mycobacteriales bacterium]|nr:serine/threonine-protein kinase [Mycobacteriales bacterium]
MGRTGAPQGAPPDLNGYVLIRHLGSGGFADVFLYEQQPLGLKVAVKVLRSSDLTTEMTERFSEEATLMAQLQHRHIAPVMGSGTSTDGRPFIVMKYYSQPNLAVRARREHFTVTQVLRMGVQLASAVETAHRAKILHRDIKPANILTDQYGDIGLTDFGLASRGVQPSSESDGVSVPWSPAEVLYASDDADERSDIFALSATLWHLLAGRSPFEIDGGDNSTAALMQRIRAGDISPIDRDDVPESLVRVLRWGMATKQAARPESALTFARSLQAIEQELKLAPTPLLLVDESPDPAAIVGEQTTTLTTRRPPTIGDTSAPRVTPRATAPAVTPVRPASPAPRPRAPIPAAPRTIETERRAPQVQPEVVTPAAPPAPDRRRPLIGALVAVVTVIVVVGIVLATRGNGSNDNSNEPAPTDNQTALVGQNIQPDPTQPSIIVSQLNHSTVRFSWTYNRLDGDVAHYSVTRQGGKTIEGHTADSSLTIPLASGSACLRLTIVRSTGKSSPESKKCT